MLCWCRSLLSLGFACMGRLQRGMRRRDGPVGHCFYLCRPRITTSHRQATWPGIFSSRDRVGCTAEGARNSFTQVWNPTKTTPWSALQWLFSASKHRLTRPSARCRTHRLESRCCIRHVDVSLSIRRPSREHVAQTSPLHLEPLGVSDCARSHVRSSAQSVRLGREAVICRWNSSEGEIRVPNQETGASRSFTSHRDSNSRQRCATALTCLLAGQ